MSPREQVLWDAAIALAADDAGLPLAIGVSTTVPGLAEIPATYLHVNTAHCRLARIAERTGRDLHRVGDLIEILIAARLAEAAARD